MGGCKRGVGGGDEGVELDCVGVVVGGGGSGGGSGGGVFVEGERCGFGGFGGEEGAGFRFCF